MHPAITAATIFLIYGNEWPLYNCIYICAQLFQTQPTSLFALRRNPQKTESEFRSNYAVTRKEWEREGENGKKRDELHGSCHSRIAQPFSSPFRIGVGNSFLFREGLLHNSFSVATNEGAQGTYLVTGLKVKCDISYSNQMASHVLSMTNLGNRKMLPLLQTFCFIIHCRSRKITVKTNIIIRGFIPYVHYINQCTIMKTEDL